MYCRAKKQQLRFASRSRVTGHEWSSDYQIDAIGVAGGLTTDNLRFAPRVVEVDI